MSKWDILVCEFLTLRMHPQCTPKYIIYSILSQAVFFFHCLSCLPEFLRIHKHYLSVIWPMLSSFSFLTFVFLSFGQLSILLIFTIPFIPRASSSDLIKTLNTLIYSHLLDVLVSESPQLDSELGKE